jgi:zinc/manganese transport system substrate-binding protein/manganese/iron transport system substrate-binding protein
VHEAGDDHDHDHGDLNPHLWTSPRMAQGMVTEIAEGLAAKDRAHGDAYLERASAYNEQLGALDEWILAQYARVPAEARVLVTGHDSLRYYLHDYDIAFAGSLLPSFEDNAEPSAAEIDALVAAIKQRGVKAIFVESSLSPKLAQTVAREAGVTVVDAESLYADSLGPKGSGAETYISATAHNTRVILEAWGAAVDPLPSQLEGQ